LIDAVVKDVVFQYIKANGLANCDAEQRRRIAKMVKDLPFDKKCLIRVWLLAASAMSVMKIDSTSALMGIPIPFGDGVAKTTKCKSGWNDSASSGNHPTRAP
jgi:hypothetical protein